MPLGGPYGKDRNSADKSDFPPGTPPPTRDDDEWADDPQLMTDEPPSNPASGAKVAMFAIIIVVVLGAVFYGIRGDTVQNAPGKQSASSSPPTK